MERDFQPKHQQHKGWDQEMEPRCWELIYYGSTLKDTGGQELQGEGEDGMNWRLNTDIYIHHHA